MDIAQIVIKLESLTRRIIVNFRTIGIPDMCLFKLLVIRVSDNGITFMIIFFKNKKQKHLNILLYILYTIGFDQKIITNVIKAYVENICRNTVNPWPITQVLYPNTSPSINHYFLYHF